MQTDVPANWSHGLVVEALNDGGMGSLLLLHEGVEVGARIFGKQISDLMFQDVDGVDVIASLNTDQNGRLFELDVWKVDYKPLIKLPD